MLPGVLQEQWPEVHLEVYDGVRATPAALLYADSDAVAPGRSDAGATHRRIELLGHPFTLVFRPAPAFDVTVDREKAPMVLLAGSLVSLLLFLAVRGQTQVGARATRLALAMTRDLAASEARCRRLYEGSPAMLHSIDREGRLVAVSDAWLNKLGYRREEVQGRLLVEFLTPASRRYLQEQVLPAFFGSRFVDDIEYEMVQRDGSIIDVRLTAMLQPGQPAQSLALTEDVTARKRAEREALAARARVTEIRDRLAAIVDHSGDAIIGESLDGTIVAWNRGAETLFGHRAQDSLGRAIAALVPPFLAGEESALVDRVVRGEVVAQYPTRRKHRDGRIIDVSMTLSPIYDGSGSLVGVSRVVRDITPQRMLQEVQARQAAILQSAGVSIISTDPEGIIRSFNAAAERMLGFRAQDVIGAALAALIHLPRELRERAAEASGVRAGAAGGWSVADGFEALVGAARGGAVDQREWTYVRRNGSCFPVALSVSAIDAGQGRISGFTCVAVDISSRRAHEELQRTALREKETLLKEVYHRVKNNLQVVSSLFQLQLRRLPDGAARAILRQCADRVRAMALVHEKLCQLDDHEAIDIGAYVRELCETLAAAHGARERGIRITHEVEALSIGLEASMPLGLLLNELLCNSLKHAFPARAGAPGGTICVRLRRTDAGRGRLEVEDDGVGFGAQVDLEQPTSLGLRLVESLARQLGGTLHLPPRGAAGARPGACTVLQFDLERAGGPDRLASVDRRASAMAPGAPALASAGAPAETQPV
jgi:PAS domain S-box-containing protein